MTAGEYVSVNSQRGSERAEEQREAEELRRGPLDEEEELARIYVSRGLTLELARQVAHELTACPILQPRNHYRPR